MNNFINLVNSPLSEKGLCASGSLLTGGSALVWVCLLLLPWTRSILHQRPQIYFCLGGFPMKESMGSFVLCCVNVRVDTVAISAVSGIPFSWCWGKKIKRNLPDILDSSSH